jgi:hypothetical protein
MTVAKQTDEDLHRHLRETVSALLYAAKGFDSGDTEPEAAAKLMAPPLRLLLHDTTERTTSLLQHLGLKQTMLFYDSSCPLPDNPHVDIAHFALAAHTSAGRFVPHLDSQAESPDDRKWLEFHDWWAQPVVFALGGATLSRRALVLECNNKDGSSHIDRELRLSDDYAALTRENSLGLSAGPPDQVRPFPSPVPASLRQIAHEVLVSVAAVEPRAFRSKLQAVAHNRLQKPSLLPADGIAISAVQIHVEPIEPE